MSDSVAELIKHLRSRIDFTYDAPIRLVYDDAADALERLQAEVDKAEVRTWRHFEDSCPNCGDSAEVLTISGRDNHVYDAERAQCPSCKNWGQSSVSDGHAYIMWHDVPGCTCGWCKMVAATDTVRKLPTYAKGDPKEGQPFVPEVESAFVLGGRGVLPVLGAVRGRGRWEWFVLPGGFVSGAYVRITGPAYSTPEAAQAAMEAKP